MDSEQLRQQAEIDQVKEQIRFRWWEYCLKLLNARCKINDDTTFRRVMSQDLEVLPCENSYKN